MPRANEVAPAVGPASRSSAAYRMWSELLSPDPADQSGEYPAWLDRAHGCEQDAIVRKVRWLVCGLMAAALMGAIGWAVLTQRDPMFRGKPESQWIAEMERAFGSPKEWDAQVALWRSFGPEGLRVLERALKRPPPGRAYAKLYGYLKRVVPEALLRLLPQTKASARDMRRVAVLRLLGNMHRDAWPLWPTVARLLKEDDPSIRNGALLFFIQPTPVLLNHLAVADKAKLLPLVLRLANSKGPSDPGDRPTALTALRYFPEHGAQVVPVLSQALKDPDPHTRLCAASSLCAVDGEAARKAGAIHVVIQVLRGPEPSLAGLAAMELREFQKEADTAVDALTWAVEHPNEYIAWRAIGALESGFRQHAAKIIPALRKAAERNDNAGDYARIVLERLGTNAPTAEPAASVRSRP